MLDPGTAASFVDPPAPVLAVCDREAAAVIPVHHDRADIVDSDDRALRSDRRRLQVVESASKVLLKRNKGDEKRRNEPRKHSENA